MSKFLKVMVVLTAIAAMAAPAFAAEFAFHGDMNNRFNLYTNHSEFYSGAGTQALEAKTVKNPVGDKNTNTTWGDIKYRFWTEAKTNNGMVKGVYAIELGAMRFGRTGTGKSLGAGYSGDGLNIETRWAYTQFQLPSSDSKALVTIGLQPFKINSFLWAETAAGVKYTTDNFELAWMRGKELFNSSNGDSKESGDNFSARVNLKPADGVKLGLFGLYQHQNANGTSTNIASRYEVKNLGDVDMNLYSFGVDGGLTSGNIFVKWDGIYQTGSFNNTTFLGLNGNGTFGDYDLSAYLLHADIGMKMGASRLTFTSWYASGDNNDNDKDLDAFMATDVDRFDSIVLFEGGYTDDNYGTERPYLLNKGLFLNKLAYDRQQTKKLKFGGAILYMQTAEDITYSTYSSKDLGTEFDAYVSYKLYPNVEVALNGGYLVSGDAMDAFEVNQDGNADENIYRVTSRVRYKF
ncbi:MAG: hypothetical protein L3J63_08030 [Geopsychrobacter sp.]|nr:hypothetical protein [Geopsychrobacter sp.]